MTLVAHRIQCWKPPHRFAAFDLAVSLSSVVDGPAACFLSSHHNEVKSLSSTDMLAREWHCHRLWQCLWYPEEKIGDVLAVVDSTTRWRSSRRLRWSPMLTFVETEVVVAAAPPAVAFWVAEIE